MGGGTRRGANALARRQAPFLVLYRNTSFPGLKHPLLAVGPNVKSQRKTGTFALGDGRSVYATPIPRADLPSPLTPTSCERTPGWCQRQTQAGDITCSTRRS